MKYLTLFAMASLIPFAIVDARAVETTTNCNWLSFGLSIDKTNLFLGDEVLASMICSNSSNAGHYTHPAMGDPCGFGFGEFRITDFVTGKRVECRYSFASRAPHSYRLGVLNPHEVRSYTMDLTGGYALTNTGIYIVQAYGIFGTNTFNQETGKYFDVLTPPIMIRIIQREQTNAPSE